MRIAIEGCIGAGKTTQASLVAHRLGYNLLKEEVDTHPFITDFYADPPKYAFETELCFVLMHYHQLYHSSAENNCISDFSPVKDLVFAQLNLNSVNYNVFYPLYNHMINRIGIPDLAIYIELPLEELIRRIKIRGRPYELNIPHEYLNALHEGYIKNLNRLANKVSRLVISPDATRDQVSQIIVKEINKHL